MKFFICTTFIQRSIHKPMCSNETAIIFCSKLYSWKPILWVLPLAHRLPIDIVYKHTNANYRYATKYK